MSQLPHTPMRPDLATAERVVRQSVVLVESTFPAAATVADLRAHRRAKAARSATAGECGHFHDTTTRYDHAAKVLTFLLVCPTCGTERVVETMDYEPHFEPRHATVHRLPVRRPERPLPHAA